MWFTETPWPPIAIFGIVAAVLVAVWSTNKRLLPLIGVAVLVLLSLLTFVFERDYVTDKEQVEQDVVDLAWAFQKKDREKTLGYFSPQAVGLRTLIGAALETVDVENDLDIKDMSVSMVADRSQAICRFRANGTVAVQSIGNLGWQPSRFEVTWQREGDDWKITKVARLDLFKDKELGLLDGAN